MANEGWTGGQCKFDQTTDFANTLCPQNLLVAFSGPGIYTSTSHGTHPNSSFATVAPVPEDLTTVTVSGQQAGGWINSDTANVTFSSQPPTFADVQSPPPGAANFLPAPIASITYGISLASNPPMPGNPVPGDTTLTNTIACPTSSSPTEPAATVFTPPQQVIPILDGDGMYLIHYFARDCASTEELKFTQDMTGSWSTSFYTVPVNVDTQPPVVATGPLLSPPPSTNYGIADSYYLNQPNVIAKYSCTDSLSGVVSCGTQTFPPGTLNTGVITSPLDTSSTGVKTFTVNVKDAAGNIGTPVSVSYQVVAPPAVDLAVAKLAPLSASHNSSFVYNISAANFGKNPASNVVVTDPLPAGVTYSGVKAQLFYCGLKGCGYTTQGSTCSYSGNTVTCTLNSLDVTGFFNVAVYNITITVKATGAAGSTVTNTATVTSSAPDSHPGDNHSTAITKITK
jgi:fimbrial isopeptide formation D2 family protein